MKVKVKVTNKKQRRAESTYALRDFLQEVIRNPKDWQANQELIEALKAQGKLAKWDDQTRGINAVSLNTLKTAAEELLEGGYNALDQLRKSALASIEAHKEKGKAGNTQTKTGLQKKLKTQDRHIQLLEQQNMMLVYLLSELKAKAIKYASAGPTITQVLCKREMTEINAKISFSGNADLIAVALKNAT